MQLGGSFSGFSSVVRMKRLPLTHRPVNVEVCYFPGIGDTTDVHTHDVEILACYVLFTILLLRGSHVKSQKS
jgi:hypothetical protein